MIASNGNELILKNLALALKKQDQLCIRIPVIPGFNYTDDDAKHFGELFKQLGVTEVELLPFHQFGLKKYADLNRTYQLKDVKQLQKDDLLSFQKILKDYHVTAKINGW